MQSTPFVHRDNHPPVSSKLSKLSCDPVSELVPHWDGGDGGNSVESDDWCWAMSGGKKRCGGGGRRVIGGDRGGFVVVTCCYRDSCAFGLSWMDETEGVDEKEDEEEQSADLLDDCHCEGLVGVLVVQSL